MTEQGRRGNDYNNHKADHDMGKLIFESWIKQRQRILDAATRVNQRDYKTIDESLNFYYASLKALHEEYFPCIVNYTYVFRSEREKSRLGLTQDKGTNNLIHKPKDEEDNRYGVIDMVDLFAHLFRRFDSEFAKYHYPK